MRREHIQSDGSVQPVIPFEENLIFYAPLTQGDLTDHISSNTLTVLSPATCTWDSSKNMYYFNAYNMGGWNTKFRWSGLDLGIVSDPNNVSNLHYTVYWEGIFDKASSNYPSQGLYPSRFMPSVSYVEARNRYVYSGYFGTTENLNVVLGEYERIAIVVDGSLMYWYKNGTYVYSEAHTPSRGGLSYSILNTNVCVYYTYKSTSDYFFDGANYYKDIRVYNRSLSASEIAQL